MTKKRYGVAGFIAAAAIAVSGLVVPSANVVKRAPETEPNIRPGLSELTPGTGMRFMVKPLAT